MNTTAFLILSFSSLFAVIDPLGVIPFFSGLTSGRKLREKRKILIKALITAFFVLLMFTVVGHQVLEVFGITVDAFRIAGGVIFFGIGLDMLQSKPRRWHTGIGKAYAKDMEVTEDQDEDDDPSITPLAIPMIAGPGSITTVMVLTAQAPSHLGIPLVMGAVLANLLLAGAILMGADVVLAKIGRTGMKVIEKLMGLLITVIAVQLMIDGITPVITSMIS